MGAVAVASNIPTPKPVQLGVFDALVDRDAIANDVGKVPMSERAILRQLEGSDASGHRRSTFGDEVEQMLAAFFEQAIRDSGYEVAVLMLFRICAKEIDYIEIAPAWVREVFEDNEELLVETFWGNHSDRRVEPGSSDDDEEQADPQPQDATVFEATLVQLDDVLSKMEAE